MYPFIVASVTYQNLHSRHRNISFASISLADPVSAYMLLIFQFIFNLLCASFLSLILNQLLLIFLLYELVKRISFEKNIYRIDPKLKTRTRL